MSFKFDKFRRNLRIVRTCKGLSQTELSSKCELKQVKRVADIEGGRGLPTIREIINLCKILEVKIDDMLHRDAVVTLNWTSKKDPSIKT